MALIKVIRHGFEFWEAPHCLRPPLPELTAKTTVAVLAARAADYRQRKKPEAGEPNITALPSVPEEITSIQSMIIEAFGITSEQFFGRDREPRVARARVASMALCRAYTFRTVEEIGDAHNRHHRLVTYSRHRLAELQKSDPFSAAAIARVEATFLQKAA